MGTGVGGLDTLERECRNWIEEGERGVAPLFVPMMMPNAAAGVVAMRLGRARARGSASPRACATGAHAIGEAARLIQRGEVDVGRGRGHRGGADRALPGRVQAHGRDLEGGHARARSTRAATAS